MTTRKPLVLVSGRPTELAAADAITGQLVQVAAGTVGGTMAVAVSLGVQRFTISAPGTLTTDKIIVALTGQPSNGTLQDAYVSPAGTISVGLLVPTLTVGSVVAVPIVCYKVT